MGIINFFKELRSFRNMITEVEEKETAHLNLSTDELKALNDEELFFAIQDRIDNKVDAYGDMQDGFDSLNEKQQIFYAVNYLEMEVNNGGLCQFFVNSSSMVAPYISEYLEILGATEHKELFDGFISENNINLADLKSFKIRKISQFEKQLERYPSDDYDDAFYELKPLQDYLTVFVKNNIEEFER